jgi:hypothetical protein
MKRVSSLLVEKGLIKKYVAFLFGMNRSAQNNRDSWLVRVRLDYNSLITRSLTARAVNETS